MESEVGLKDLLGLPESVWLGQVTIDFNQPPLGTGSDAIVYRCVHDDLAVAAKVLHGSLIAPGNVARREFIRKFGQECRRLRQLSNPCVVSFIGVGQAPNKSPCLLVELMEESLADRIAAIPADPFLQSLSYLLDVTTGLRYLHWQKLIHRDLKPQNILIVAGKAKIADVGLARSLHGDNRMARQVMTRCPGTPNYMAPESLVEGRQYDEKLDMFALGAIVLGVFTHRVSAPTERKIRVLENGSEVATSELERRRNDLGHMDANHPTRPLVINCLLDDPAMRPSAVQAHQQLMIIQQGFGGDNKPLLSSTLGQVVTRLDGLTTAVEEQERQQQLEVRVQLRQLQNQLQEQEERHRQEVEELRQQVEEQRQEHLTEVWQKQVEHSEELGRQQVEEQRQQRAEELWQQVQELRQQVKEQRHAAALGGNEQSALSLPPPGSASPAAGGGVAGFNLESLFSSSDSGLLCAGRPSASMPPPLVLSSSLGLAVRACGGPAAYVRQCGAQQALHLNAVPSSSSLGASLPSAISTSEFSRPPPLTLPPSQGLAGSTFSMPAASAILMPPPATLPSSQGLAGSTFSMPAAGAILMPAPVTLPPSQRLAGSTFSMPAPVTLPPSQRLLGSTFSMVEADQHLSLPSPSASGGDSLASRAYVPLCRSPTVGGSSVGDMGGIHQSFLSMGISPPSPFGQPQQADWRSMGNYHSTMQQQQLRPGQLPYLPTALAPMPDS